MTKSEKISIVKMTNSPNKLFDEVMFLVLFLDYYVSSYNVKTDCLFIRPTPKIFGTRYPELFLCKAITEFCDVFYDTDFLVNRYSVSRNFLDYLFPERRHENVYQIDDLSFIFEEFSCTSAFYRRIWLLTKRIIRLGLEAHLTQARKGIIK